jgi:hypothetical protein
VIGKKIEKSQNGAGPGSYLIGQVSLYFLESGEGDKKEEGFMVIVGASRHKGE